MVRRAEESRWVLFGLENKLVVFALLLCRQLDEASNLLVLSGILVNLISRRVLIRRGWLI
jgi:hypothetical protein